VLKDIKDLKDIKVIEKLEKVRKRPLIITVLGAIATIILILVTLEISNRNPDSFVAVQQKYIIGCEAALLATFIVEMLVRLVTLRLHTPQMVEYGARLRLIVRIFGYVVGLLSVVSIIASNATLGISVGAIAGIIIAFATQNVLGSVLAAALILSTRMVRVGEEITISQTKGVIADINLIHTIISIEDDVVFIPNSLVISSIVRRKKRNSDKDAPVKDW
jgi:small-conductance mechanosensitive channel